FEKKRRRTEIVYIDKDHLHACADDPAGNKEITVTEAGGAVRLSGRDLAAICKRLSTSIDPDQVILGGDVEILSTQEGAVVRIEAPRVNVNLRDGTFRVDSVPTSSNHRRPDSPKNAAAAEPSHDAQMEPLAKRGIPHGIHLEILPVLLPAPPLSRFSD